FRPLDLHEGWGWFREVHLILCRTIRWFAIDHLPLFPRNWPRLPRFARNDPNFLSRLYFFALIAPDPGRSLSIQMIDGACPKNTLLVLQSGGIPTPNSVARNLRYWLAERWKEAFFRARQP